MPPVWRHLAPCQPILPADGERRPQATVEEAACVLEAPSTDLKATAAHSGQCPVPPITLYDNAPGGVGLGARPQEEQALKDCLEAVQQRASGNAAAMAPTSRYGRLRSCRHNLPIDTYNEIQQCATWQNRSCGGDSSQEKGSRRANNPLQPTASWLASLASVAAAEGGAVSLPTPCRTRWTGGT